MAFDFSNIFLNISEYLNRAVWSGTSVSCMYVAGYKRINIHFTIHLVSLTNIQFAYVEDPFLLFCQPFLKSEDQFIHILNWIKAERNIKSNQSAVVLNFIHELDK